jgi:endonuclease/exonuclease/phosphatase family metal-dependent hydrolase
VPRLTLPSNLGRTAPPAASRTRFATLAQALDGVIPAKTADNLLIGTWNIALLGGLTQKWATEPRDSPKRNLTDICCLAEVVSRFDVCAIQETQRSLVALRMLTRALGPTWRFITTDVTEGTRGKSERLVYVYDESRVRASGLAGELVIPEERLGLTPGAIDRQFARTPFAVSFVTTRHGKAFTLVTLHIWFGDHPSERRPELQATADWLARRAGEDDDFNRNMIALGDFNIDKRDDENWQAFASAGLGPPKELNDVPRNIAHRTAGAKFYDQIAWFDEGNRRMLTLGFTTAGSFMWTDHLDGFRDNVARKAHISDHYPLWAEFSLT